MGESSLNISKYVEVDTWVSVCDSRRLGHRLFVCWLFPIIRYILVAMTMTQSTPLSSILIYKLSISAPLDPLQEYKEYDVCEVRCTTTVVCRPCEFVA